MVMKMIFQVMICTLFCVGVLGELTNYVDGFIGTSHWINADDSASANFGNTVPQLGMPFAHTPLSPQTRAGEAKCQSPYYYDDEYFMGFRKTHFMSGSCVIEYGSVSVLPSVSLDLSEATTYHRLNHTVENWSPAKYEVTLPESGLKVSGTNDNAAGLVKVNSKDAKTDTFYILVASFDTSYNESTVEITSTSSVLVSNPVHRWYLQMGESAGFSGHHSIKFSQTAISSVIIEADGTISVGATSGKSGSAGTATAYFEFQSSMKNEVIAAIGSSFISRDKAEVNLQSELAAAPYGLFDFNNVVSRVNTAWNTRLSSLKVSQSETRADFDAAVEQSNMRVFYTAVWHSLLLPRVASDADGEYLKFDGSQRIMQVDAAGGLYFDDFSQWDIYRATIPLQFFLASDMVPHMVTSLIAKTDQGGWMPIFPAWNSYTQEMIGDHCSVLVVDAFVKGLMPLDSNEDPDVATFAEHAYQVMRRSALEVPPLHEYAQGKGRRGVHDYLKLGYIPLEDSIPLPTHSNEQVSRTLEYAYNDYVLAQMAKLLNHVEDMTTLLDHSENYRNVIDSDGVGFVRGKHLNGSWVGTEGDFDENADVSWITEGTPYQYTWYVPHQVESLIELYKGNEAYVQKLNTFFDDGSYNHGNEPDHQAIFMYAYSNGTANGSWRVQQRVREVLQGEYADAPGGLAGNDDAGQTSSWYVLSALGFYPVCPGCGGYSEYTLSTPLFDEAIISPCGADTECAPFKITAMKATADDIYIQSGTLNGEDYDCAFLPHNAIVQGGTLVFKLGATPNTAWGNTGRSCLDVYFGSK